MELKLASLELSKLAKAKGFIEPTIFYYTNRIITAWELSQGYNFNDNYPPYKLHEPYLNDYEHYIKIDDIKKYYPNDINAPELEFLHLWLREKHNKFIVISLSTTGFIYSIIDIKNNKYIKSLPDSSDNDYSYNEALEFGLFEALKLIKK